MGAGSGPSHPELDDLRRQVQDLQTRVLSLERHIGVHKPAPKAAQPPPVAAESGPSSVGGGAGVFPLVGKALLGLSAAYLLRALSELGVVPLSTGVAVAMVYALGWLVLAARTAASERLAAALYGLTSVLILVPLLWEARVRFQVASSWSVAGVLVLFAVFGLAISWRKNLDIVAWITTLAGVMTAAGLLTATRDLLPFTVALLAIAAAVEGSACLEHWLRERWVVALVSDLTVVLLIYLTTRPAGLPEGYTTISQTAVLAVAAALLLIYLASAIVRTLWRGFTFTNFEVAQCVVVFVISATGALQVARGNPAAVLAVAVFILVCGTACYLVSFAVLERKGDQDRNFYTNATFGLLLALAGSYFLLGGLWLAVLWSLLGVALVGAGKHARRATLKWHGGAYLLLAGIASGLTGAAVRRFLLGAGHDSAGFTEPAAWVAMIAALTAYLVAARGAAWESASWNSRLLLVFLSGSAALSIAGMAAEMLIPLCRAGGATGAPDYCPTLLTAVLTGFAVGLASAGVFWRRLELSWPVYLLMTIATYKLLAQDLRQSYALAIVISLLLYGATLILLPRILQRTRYQPH